MGADQRELSARRGGGDSAGGAPSTCVSHPRPAAPRGSGTPRRCERGNRSRPRSADLARRPGSREPTGSRSGARAWGCRDANYRSCAADDRPLRDLRQGTRGVAHARGSLTASVSPV